MRSKAATSGTVRAIGPATSCGGLTGRMPDGETLPHVGRRPVMPVSAAGMRIEDPVSVPTAHHAMPAATATAEPPLEPPGMRSMSHGLRQLPKKAFCVVPP